MTKNNLLKGIPWRFGPDWTGQRYELESEEASYANVLPLPAGSCRLHGGTSTGPMTKDGQN